MKNINSKKINIALIGCGRISQKHILAIISENKRCELVAICDNNKERVENIYKFYEKKSKEKNIVFKDLYKFNDFEELINAKRNNKIIIDLIVLATPSGLHPKQTIIAAKSGINVCTEKPMAINVKDGNEMIKICKDSNVKLYVDKRNRLNPTLQI